MLTTKELIQIYSEMEQYKAAPFADGRYKLNIGGSKYWLSKDGSLELISTHAPKKAKHSWMTFN